jgi:hypothetical protein
MSQRRCGVVARRDDCQTLGCLSCPDCEAPSFEGRRQRLSIFGGANPRTPAHAIAAPREWAALGWTAQV